MVIKIAVQINLIIKQTIKTGVECKTMSIDALPYFFLEEKESQALGERRVGLGIMA